MKDIRISQDDLDSLVNALAFLSITSNCTHRLDVFIDLMKTFIPFDKCLLLHETSDHSGQLILKHEFSENLNEKTKIHRSEKSLNLDLFLGRLKKTTTFQNAFISHGIQSNIKDVENECYALFNQFELNKEITACATSDQKSSDKGVTLIFLQKNEGNSLSSNHLVLLNAINQCLHFSLLRSAPAISAQVDARKLTTMEGEVLQWVVEGKTSWEVGKILSIKERTVKFHLKNIYEKFNVRNRAQAVATANSLGFLCTSTSKSSLSSVN